LTTRIADLLGFVGLQNGSNNLVVGVPRRHEAALNLAAALVHEAQAAQGL
jgi:hypothetical protein